MRSLGTRFDWFYYCLSCGECLRCSVYAEQFPPLNFEQDGEIVGIGADQVFEMMKRSGAVLT